MFIQLTSRNLDNNQFYTIFNDFPNKLFSFFRFVQGFRYYGFTLGVSSLSGNMTVNMVLMDLGETMSMGVVWLLSK